VLLETCQNFRDLGGYATSGGRTVAWGRLYRADTLHRLSAADLDAIVALDVRTVIDLRGHGELERHGRIHVGDHDIAYHHLPMLDEVAGEDRRPSPPEPVADLGEAYVRMLGEGTPTIAQSVRLLARPDALPAVFHCMAGKDRTGILAAVILGALEVPDDEIVADYVLTADVREARTAYLAVHDPDYLLHLQSLPPYALETKAASMESFLAHVRRQYGSMRGFLSEVGVDGVTVDRLAEALLD
jgi:protein-tyrosine phosphatase